MKRLTDKKVAADLKHNAESLQARGFKVDYSHLIYIKLAEYEDEEERRACVLTVPENDENYID